MSIEEEYQKIITAFPNVQIVGSYISHIRIPLVNNVFLDIDFKNYPKKPKVNLIRPDGQSYRNIDKMVSTLKYWKKSEPYSIVDIIQDLVMFINRVGSDEIAIKRELMDGILDLCKNQHPREILGILRVEGGIVTEYILPPGAKTSESSGVFSPGRIPMDSSLEGTVHSHPTGNPYPSNIDLQTVFMTKRFHFIVAYPYTYDKIRCFDQRGNERKYILVP
jgi:proteasome lid subunit RPN8/RPN11